MRTERRARGDQAEQLVVEALERQGYRVLDRNVRCRFGELDVVAERGEVLAFVEVRMRSRDTFGGPLGSVLPAKQRRVVLAATEYCQRRGLLQRAIRFDVASVVGAGPGAVLSYVEDAFQAWF